MLTIFLSNRDEMSNIIEDPPKMLPVNAALLGEMVSENFRN
jgi:hypothetical protein